MTDEEKAEEYANKILSDSKYPFICSKEKVKVYIIKVYLDSLKCCKNAYNIGLAEGRKEKWHDLRENSNDLPKKDGTYLVSISLSNQIITDTHEYRDGYFSKHLRIIAWCELPQFKE